MQNSKNIVNGGALILHDMAEHTTSNAKQLSDLDYLLSTTMNDSNYHEGVIDQTALAALESVQMDVALNPGNLSSSNRCYSRTSSTGSVHFSCSSASSAQNSDDEDSDGRPQSFRDRRREAHTQAEQKRRDAIKKGYDDLASLVPKCQSADPVGGQKLSKAAILQRSIEYITYLQKEKSKQTDDLESLKKEVVALKIMKANYEHIVKSYKNTPEAGQNQVSDEIKFQVFQEIMDNLFASFNASISVANFAELSACVFTWLEEHCKPQLLRELTLKILQRFNANFG